MTVLMMQVSILFLLSAYFKHLDSITLILKQEGFDDNSPSTCDIHLARSLIDRILEEKNKIEESQQRQQSPQLQEANNLSNNLVENTDDTIKTATEVEAGEEIDYG